MPLKSYDKKQIFIAFGSNLQGADGSPPALVCRQALEALKEIPGLAFQAVSANYCSVSVPDAALPSYVNNVALFAAEGLLASDILTVLLATENRFGRVRTCPNAPRILDLDLVACDDEQCYTEFLTLPHPRMHERPFVLMPMADLQSDWQHPVYKKTAAGLLAALNFAPENCYRLT